MIKVGRRIRDFSHVILVREPDKDPRLQTTQHTKVVKTEESPQKEGGKNCSRSTYPLLRYRRIPYGSRIQRKRIRINWMTETTMLHRRSQSTNGCGWEKTARKSQAKARTLLHMRSARPRTLRVAHPPDRVQTDSTEWESADAISCPRPKPLCPQGVWERPNSCRHKIVKFWQKSKQAGGKRGLPEYLTPTEAESGQKTLTLDCFTCKL